MGVLPAINTLLYVMVNEMSYRSRVENVAGQTLTIAAPMGRGDLELPDPGSELAVFWVSSSGRFVMPVRLDGRYREPVPHWIVTSIGEPARKSRRRFVRGVYNGTVEIQIVANDDRHGQAVGTVVDISEGGLRCTTPPFDLLPGDRVCVTVDLAGQRVNLSGSVLTVRGTETPKGLDVVIVYEPPESAAQVIRRYVFQWEIAERRKQREKEAAAVL